MPNSNQDENDGLESLHYGPLGDIPEKYAKSMPKEYYMNPRKRIPNYKSNVMFSQDNVNEKLLPLPSLYDKESDFPTEYQHISRFPIEYKYMSKEDGKKYLSNEFKNHQFEHKSEQYQRLNQQLGQGSDLDSTLSVSINTPKRLIDICIVALPILIVGFIITGILLANLKKKKKELHGGISKGRPSSSEKESKIHFNFDEHLRNDSVRYRRKFQLEREKRFDNIMQRASQKTKGLRSDVVKKHNYTTDELMETSELDSFHNKPNVPDRKDLFSGDDSNRACAGVVQKQRLSGGNFVQQLSASSLFRLDDKESYDNSDDFLKKDETGCASINSDSESYMIGMDIPTSVENLSYYSTTASTFPLPSPVDGPNTNTASDKNPKVCVIFNDLSHSLATIYSANNEECLMINSSSGNNITIQKTNDEKLSFSSREVQDSWKS